LKEEQTKNYSVLVVAVISVSWASIFIRLTGAPPLATAFYRMGLASLFLIPISLYKYLPEIKEIKGKLLFFSSLSGIFLALHFVFWITSLYYTTISNSVVLVTTQPIFVALLSHFILKEKVRFIGFSGIILALIGAFIISKGDMAIGKENFIGDVLALLGAIMAALYLFFGRVVRQRLNLVPYIFTVYTISAITIGIIAIFYKTPFYPYPKITFFWFILLALVPQLVGHTLYNWALKHLKAYLVGTSILGEPIGATILAYLFFKEIPFIQTYIGGGMILFGIYLVFYSERGKRAIK